MKNAIGFIAALLCTSTLYGQFFFNKVYDFDGQLETLKSVAVVPDGYIFAGTTWHPFTGEGKVYLLKTDERGDTLWSKLFGLPNYEYQAGHVIETNSGFVFFYTSVDRITPNAEYHIFKTNFEGERLWENTFGLGVELDGTRKAIQTDDGGFLLCGFSQNFPDNIAQAYLVKTDAEGNLEWENAYGLPSASEGANDLLQTPDGGYVILAYRDKLNGDRDAWLFKINANGDSILWEKTVGGDYFDEAGGLAMTSDGGYIFVGSKYDNFTWLGQSEAWVVKLDSNRNVEWERTYGETDVNTYEDFRKVLALPDGGYALAGSTRSYNPPWDDTSGWLMKINAQGDSLWAQLYSPKADVVSNLLDDYLWDVQLAPDGGFVMCGFGFTEYIPDVSTQDAWMVKTDSLGNTCHTTHCDSSEFTFAPNIAGHQAAFSFYPNPASGVLHFNQLPPNGFVELLNMQGKVVFREKTGDNLSWDVSGLPSGVYMVQHIAPSGISGSRKLFVGR